MPPYHPDDNTADYPLDPPGEPADRVTWGIDTYNQRLAAFEADLETLINHHSLENGSDTPDFILASYLRECLATFNLALTARERWYGRSLNGPPSPATEEPPHE
jgi:hypothetical protein